MTVGMHHPISGGTYAAQPGQVEHLKQSGWELDDPTADYDRWPAELQRFEGQEAVEIYNPTTGAYYTSPESAVPIHRSNGWLIVGSDDYKAAIEGQAESELEDMTVADLRELAKERGISPIPTTKAELVAALQDTEQEHEQDVDEQPAEPATTEEE